VLGQLVSLAPSGYTGVLSLADRSEARLRSNPGAAPSVDLETLPVSAVSLTGRRSSYLIGYGPRLSWLDVNNNPEFTVMHTGRVTTSFWGRRTRLTLSLDGAIGKQGAAGLAVTAPLLGAPARDVPAPAAGVTPAPAGPPAAAAAPASTVYYLPPSAVLTTGSFRGSVGVSETLSRRWVGSANGYYTIAGGFDYPSQQAVPPMRGGGGSLTATFAASKVDAYVSRLSSDYVYVLTTTDKFLTVSALESLRHSFSPHTQGTIGLGVSSLFARRGDGPLSGGIFASGEAALFHAAPLSADERVVTRVSVQVAQAYNPLLGEIQDLATGTLSASWTRDTVSVTATVSAATSIPVHATDAARGAFGGVTIGDALGKVVTVQAGVRTAVQLFQSDANATYPAQWAVFLAVLLTAPPSRF
jgi:hypothetical protein